ncbi:MAG: hypothetical protein OXC42_01360, partial [Gammaproteobacteria bacterium]|nr:hypothetical protein [Gammaproteobacteria bacterium]
MGLGFPATAHNENCDNSTSGAPIHCDEAATSTDDITIDVEGIDIDAATTAPDHNDVGVKAVQGGSGNITIDIAGTTAGGKTTASMIDTTLENGHGIYAQINGATGTLAITTEDTEITAVGKYAIGVYALDKANGHSTVTLNAGTIISTGSSASHGVQLTNQSTGTTPSNVTLTADEVTITTEGISAHGLWATREAGLGDVLMTISDSTITTEGTGDNGSYGIFGYRYGNGDGALTIDLTNGSTTTKGPLSFGIYAHHQNGDNHNATGDITLNIQNHDILTESKSIGSVPGGTYSYGIYAVHRNSGNIVINIDDMQTGSSVTTKGQNSHGIVAYHYGEAATRSIDITVGGTVTTEGADAQGVRVGAVSSGVPARMASLDDDDYRRQKVTVNNRISSHGPGIYLTNGGRVIIGPRGSITSTSGIAILATGTVPEVPEDNTDPMNVIPAIPAISPKLQVDLNLGGRRITQALGDDWIINDGGETTIAMNGTVLHGKYEENGTEMFGVVPDTKAANGVWDVTMLAEGVKITDRSNADPAMWVVSDRAAGVITGRDFSAADFTEMQVRFPPPPPTTPPPEPEATQVNAPVVADASAPAAVIVEGDDTIQIGAQGTLRAASGIAILATGDTPELTVDMALDGRQVGQVIGDNWIINDGGGTTLVINGVKLHDATTGVVPGAAAPN